MSLTHAGATAAAASGITYPEITEMQVKAIISAAMRTAQRRKDQGDSRDHDSARGNVTEFRDQKEIATRVAEKP